MMRVDIFFSSRRRHTRLQGDWASDVCFFFSSRRRHTRLQGDWSSDVCSSDLKTQSLNIQGGRLLISDEFARALGRPSDAGTYVGSLSIGAMMQPIEITQIVSGEIGRASCRERSVDLGGRRIIKKKKKKKKMSR